MGASGATPGFDVELLQQRMKSDPRHDAAEPDSQGAVLIVHAHGDHRALETRIADAGHGEQNCPVRKGA
jgi:L-ascorbate metabolism protein UlaG (beta-lactamase superfamily)